MIEWTAVVGVGGADKVEIAFEKFAVAGGAAEELAVAIVVARIREN